MTKEEFLFRILVCFFLSLLVGIERQLRGRKVGLRTSILVSLGAFLYVSFSFMVVNPDKTRIAAQVVTGIGFLGAGVIIKDGFNIRGLTTAATLWCDAAVGVLCTAGLIYEAFVGTTLILFANIILRFLNKKINLLRSSNCKMSRYFLEVNNSDSFDDVYNDIINLKANIIGFKSNKDKLVFEFDLNESAINKLNEVTKKIKCNRKIKSFSLYKKSEFVNAEEEEI